MEYIDCVEFCFGVFIRFGLKRHASEVTHKYVISKIAAFDFKVLVLRRYLSIRL